jgi:hypothetical protein
MPEVRCDICGDPMHKQADLYACYPCKNLIWESELPQFEDAVCQTQSTSTPNNSSP